MKSGLKSNLIPTTTASDTATWEGAVNEHHVSEVNEFFCQRRPKLPGASRQARMLGSVSLIY